MPGKSRVTALLAATMVLASMPACGSTLALRRQLLAPTQLEQFDRKSPYLKAHMRSGDVYVLTTWRVDSALRVVSGSGKRYDLNRRADTATLHVVKLDSVALFESNVLQPHGSVTALAVVSVLSAATTFACAANPKACFGSCPTFYLGDGADALLEAEGFSASVAPSLEATDVDALYRARPTSRRFELRMTNEALETHVVRAARVLAVHRPAGARVFAAASGEFWTATTPVPPSRCSAGEGDCLAAVTAFDDSERFSLADSTNLAAREMIELEFPHVAGDTLGLVISSRQTLLSTFLLYQTLAYMGTRASDWLAALERNDGLRGRANNVADVLGGIEVQALDGRGRWRPVAEIVETGPLATDTKVIPLPSLPEGASRLRLRLTRGAWRINYLALASLRRAPAPEVLEPKQIIRGGREDADALRRLRDTTIALVTLPGDEYVLVYELPERFEEYELFLQSRGYYLEWMREQWLAEENPA
ncbi:MAG: hypothetical protein ACRENU_07980, partial [Gemmatimonadaceae bacterium]